MNYTSVSVRLYSVVILLLCSFGLAKAQGSVGDIPVPYGFSRVEADGFGGYLRSLPLKAEGTKVRLYDGSLKAYQGGVYRIVDMEIGKSDLQQCADAVIRLRAEYLWKEKRYSEIHFNFTNGWRADYSTWAEGYRVSVSGNKTSWYKATEPDYSYSSFRKYLDVVFTYAGTASLSKELSKVNLSEISIGDVFIQGGFPGHAMIVVDMAEDSSGRKAILVAQSYMPAQEIHIVKNLRTPSSSPWYVIEGSTRQFSFPEWSFGDGDLKRF